jgi:hypothetical protein
MFVRFVLLHRSDINRVSLGHGIMWCFECTYFNGGVSSILISSPIQLHFTLFFLQWVAIEIDCACDVDATGHAHVHANFVYVCKRTQGFIS